MISFLLTQRKKVAILIVSFLLFSIGVIAQSEMQKVMTPPSPNAASLGSFGDIPVSNYTGKINLSIPLPSIITSSGYELPISITYNSGGVKIDEMPSLVGMSWVLNAGGVITRSIKGTDDFGLNGWYHDNKVIPIPTSSLNPNTCQDVNGNSFNYLYTCATNGTYDTEPDLYYFNFQSYSGKFFFERDRSIVKFKDENIKMEDVVYTNSGLQIQNYATSLNWSFSDEFGNKYLFNNSENEFSETSYTSDDFTRYRETKYDEEGNIIGYDDHNIYNTNINIPKTYSINSNYLSEIQLSNNEVIHFEYESFIQDYMVSKEYNHGYLINVLDKPFVNYDGDAFISSELRISNKINAKRLKQITYKDYNVIFSYVETDGIIQLNEIIYKHKNDIFKKIIFYYLNFFDKKRFFLSKLSYKDINSLSSSIDYIFEYNNPQFLPHRLSTKQDSWGYFNNNQSNRLDPEIPMNIFNYFSRNTNLGFDYRNINTNYLNVNREFDAEKSKIGLLTKVIYPTKGYTVFEYESNSYLDQIQSIIVNGAGNRIRRINNYDNNDILLTTKDFIYESGKLMTMPNHYSYFARRAHFIEGGTYHYVYSNSNSVIPLSTDASGNYVGYDKVKIFNNNFQDENNGYEEFSYFNTANQLSNLYLQWNNFIINYNLPIILYPTSSARISSNNYTNGILKYKNTFERGDNSYKLKQEEKYKYNLSNESTTYITKYGSKENDVNLNDCKWIYKLNYFIQSANVQLVEKDVINYENTGLRKNHSWYSYNNGGGLLLTGENANGIYTDYTYLNTNIDPQNPHYRLKILSSKKTYRGGIVLNHEMYDYNNKYQPIKVTTKSFQNLGNSAGNVGTLENVSEKQIFYNSNVVEKVVEQDGTTETYLWDNDLIKPIAKCENAELYDVAYTSFENDNAKGRFDYNNSSVNNSSSRTGKRDYLLTANSPITTSIVSNGTYKFYIWVKNGAVNFNLSLTTDVSGLIISSNPNVETYSNFEWSLYTYTLTKNNNLVANISLNGNATIDEIRISPINSEITTFTYLPYFGITSMSDNRGQVSTYEYDGFGKVYRMKDHEGNIINELRYNYKQ